jgi:2-polyprenyl-3-methyl-5-hydroxy-6-metoxy-1,4-benzoquinol methylase
MEPRFEFGKNWQAFLATITDSSVLEAENGLRKLFPDQELHDATFLDVGCGSGLSMLAAIRLGAREVQGIDLDPHSVTATEQLLAGQNARVLQKSIFDASPRDIGAFDIVYSWGVLHHTGAMWQALERTCNLVRPGGLLGIALYRKTPLCPFWTFEKRMYTRAPRVLQTIIRGVYKGTFLAGVISKGKSPMAYIRDYRSARGMIWHHDVHDWLGGYPYESATAEEVKLHLANHGFKIVRTFETPARTAGLFASHCDEFVAQFRP